MDERLEHILGLVTSTDLDRVAAGATGIAGASCETRPVYEVLNTTRADLRTLGIVKVTGKARRTDGTAGPDWSAVAKVVDLAERLIGDVFWTRPEIEEVVYEKQYFVNEGHRFRPAHCYGVSHPSETVRIFWIEDLTGAEHAPFSVDQLAEMARHLGEWSGFHQDLPALAFPVPRDLFAVRWGQDALRARYRRFVELEPEAVALVYRDVPRDALIQLRGLLTAQNERTVALPHCLAFGDCQVGNLFHRPNETIAVDWASLAYDPIGADAGSMIGSALGRVGLLTIARNERALFGCYVDGLRASGWRGNVDDVRRAYFCQYGHYLASTLGLMPVIFAFDEWPRAEIELRMRARWEEVPDLIAPVIAMYPAYIAELQALAAR
jgi:hypothetical protein